MAKKDAYFYHLYGFEVAIEKLGIDFFYAKKENRKVALIVKDHDFLLKEYANEAYNICCDNNVDSVYKKIVLEANNLIEGKDVCLRFKKIRGTTNAMTKFPGHVELFVYEELRKVLIRLRNIYHLNHSGALIMLYRHDKKCFEFDKKYLNGKELSWDVSVAFFLLMKIYEIFISLGFKLV